MSVNRYRPHIIALPEDEADLDLLNGFRLHPAVNPRAVGDHAPAGGWAVARHVLEAELLPYIQANAQAYAVLVIDFDNNLSRYDWYFERVPDALRERVFVIGARLRPEDLRQAVGGSYERIGRELAEGCLQPDCGLWAHDQLSHNRHELERLARTVKPFLFTAY